MIKPSADQQLNRASDSDLLEIGQQMLSLTVAISKEINHLYLSEQHQPFSEELQKIVQATGQLSDLIKQSFSRNSCKSATEIQTISGTIQHDLNTPIIAITGYSELLHEELAAEGDSRGCEILEVVLQLSQELLNLIKEMDYLAEVTSLLASVVATTDNLNHQEDGFEDDDHSTMLEVISGMRKNSPHQESANLLVVDDKESNRDFLSRRLFKHGVYGLCGCKRPTVVE